MEVAEKMSAVVVIICDNPKLEKQILKKIWFKDPSIRIITSQKLPFKDFIQNVASKSWANVACAHMTTLFHAKKMGYKSFWNIDADDTLFLLPVESVVTLLRKAASYAEKEDIDLFSLDMWKSRTLGKHWSWGITYVRDKRDLLKKISSEKNTDWVKLYEKEFEFNNYNSDWHINSLVKRGTDLKIASFYPKSTGFIHWGDLLFNPVGSYVCRWRKDGVIDYPLMKAMGIPELAEIPINK